MDDAALNAAQWALDGLSARQQVISRNLANVDTPGYRAQQLNFENALSQAQQQQAPTLHLAATSSAHLAAPNTEGDGRVLISQRPGGSLRADGNNVDVDQELLEMSHTGIQYQALTQLVSKKLLLLKAIATGR
jgi:flagellar basal-body rod protein FlgB